MLNIITFGIAFLIVLLGETQFDYTKRDKDGWTAEENSSTLRVVLSHFLIVPIGLGVIYMIIALALAGIAHLLDYQLPDNRLYEMDILLLVIWITAITFFFETKGFIQGIEKGKFNPTTKWRVGNDVQFYLCILVISLSIIWSTIDEIKTVIAVFSGHSKGVKSGNFDFILFLIGDIPMIVSAYCLFNYRSLIGQQSLKYSGLGVLGSVLYFPWEIIVRGAMIVSLVMVIIGLFISP